METIYDHNPTPAEFMAVGNNGLSRVEYLERRSSESIWADLAMLFNLRQDRENEIRAWSYIPDLRDEFMRGLDVIDED